MSRSAVKRLLKGGRKKHQLKMQRKRLNIVCLQDALDKPVDLLLRVRKDTDR
jgi:hypothetical protein